MKFFFLNFTTKSSVGFLAIFLLFLLSLSSVSALGVTPPLAYADYSENFNDSFTFMLINNNPDPNIEIELSLKGPLAEYATLSEKSFNFESKNHAFTVFFDFPSYEKMGLYGKQKLRVRAAEVGKKNGMFTVGTAVEVWIEVYIPVPGSFAEVSSVNVDNAFQGENTNLKFVLTNRGTDDISGASAKVYLRDYNGKTLDTLAYPSISIPFDKSLTFEENLFTSDFVSGIYTANVEFNFDPGFAPSKNSATFFLGSSDVIITNYTNELIAGQINKVIVTTQSLWGSALQNVGYTLNYDGLSRVLPSVTYNPFQERRFETFIEAPLIENKKLDSMPLSAKMDLVIPLGDGDSIEKSIPLDFVVLKEKSSFIISSTTLLIIGGVLLLVIIIFANILIFKRLSANNSSNKKSNK